MTADPLAYCLENTSDHSEFERFATALMEADGFKGIEPLGGSTDRGRDAVLGCSRHGINVIFAYSLRTDWRRKLREDAESAQRHGHACEEFVFVTTGAVTATQRDTLRETHREKYGWELTLYPRERVIHLLGQHSHLIARFPALFPPATVSGLHRSHPDRQTVVILADSSDSSLANWIYDRLTLGGYRVWSNIRDIAAGCGTAEIQASLESSAKCVLELIPATQYEDELLQELIRDVESLARQRSSPAVFPLLTKGSDLSLRSRYAADLTAIDFEDWSSGASELIRNLQRLDVQRTESMSPLHALTERVDEFISSESEVLVSNAFPVASVPESIRLYHMAKPFKAGERRSVADDWAFRRIGNLCLSFTDPPDDHRRSFEIEFDDSIEWRSTVTIEDVYSRHIISELIRKELFCTMIQSGLAFGKPRPSSKKRNQDRRGPLHFPKSLVERDSISVVVPGAAKPQRVQVIGQGQRKSKRPYTYHLSPRFVVADSTIEPDEFTVLSLPQFYITTDSGEPLSKKLFHRKRRNLGKSLRNKRHRNFALAAIEFLGKGEDIQLANPEDPIVISRIPICPVILTRMTPPAPKIPSQID